MPDIVTNMDLRGWDVVVAVGVVAVLVVGCSHDPDPVVTPTPSITAPTVESPSPTPTPSPSPTELTEEEVLAAVPQAARSEDFPGAQHFVEFFIELYPQLFQEPYDGRLFLALSGPDCVFCQSALENQELAEANRTSTGGGVFAFDWSIAQGGLRENGDWLVEQRFSVTDTEYLDEKGSVTEVVGGGEGTVVARLKFTEGMWLVDDIAFEFDDE